MPLANQMSELRSAMRKLPKYRLLQLAIDCCAWFNEERPTNMLKMSKDDLIGFVIQHDPLQGAKGLFAFLNQWFESEIQKGLLS